MWSGALKSISREYSQAIMFPTRLGERIISGDVRDETEMSGSPRIVSGESPGTGLKAFIREKVALRDAFA